MYLRRRRQTPQALTQTLCAGADCNSPITLTFSGIELCAGLVDPDGTEAIGFTGINGTYTIANPEGGYNYGVNDSCLWQNGAVQGDPESIGTVTLRFSDGTEFVQTVATGIICTAGVTIVGVANPVISFGFNCGIFINDPGGTNNVAVCGDDTLLPFTRFHGGSYSLG